MTDKQLKTTYQLFTDLWQLFKTYVNAGTDEQLEQCTEQASKIVEQYGEEARPLVLDTLELIERRNK